MILLMMGCLVLLGALMLTIVYAAHRAPTMRRSLLIVHCHPSREVANVMAYRDERAEVERAHRAKELSDEQYEMACMAIDRRLLDAIQSGEDVATGSVNAGKCGARGAMIVAVLTVVVGYLHFGARDDLRLHDVWQSVAERPRATVKDYVDSLEPLAHLQPHNPHVWAVLWPLYTNIGHYDGAIFALRQQMRIEGESTQGLAQLAQMRFMAAGGVVTPEVAVLCHQILAVEPEHPAIQGMLGVAAYTRHDYRQALEHWQLALDGGADAQGLGARIRENMAQARQQLQALGPPSTIPARHVQ